MPSRPHRKSRCHHERRNSPSVMPCSPTSSCFLMTRSISRSSTVLRSVAVISPFWRFSRASFRELGRSRLPTWSARNGGLVRFILSSRDRRRADLRGHDSERIRPPPSLPPHLLCEFHDLPHFVPLLLLGENVALLGRGEAALRRERELL